MYVRVHAVGLKQDTVEQGSALVGAEMVIQLFKLVHLLSSLSVKAIYRGARHTSHPVPFPNQTTLLLTLSDVAACFVEVWLCALVTERERERELRLGKLYISVSILNTD